MGLDDEDVTSQRSHDRAVPTEASYGVNRRKKLSGFHCGRALSLAIMIVSAVMNWLYAAAAVRSTGWLRSSDGAWYRFVSHALSIASSADPVRLPKSILTAGIPWRMKLYWSLRTNTFLCGAGSSWTSTFIDAATLRTSEPRSDSPSP